MSDTKDRYSGSSTQFVNEAADNNPETKKLFEKSKRREKLHNSDWLNRKVDINDIVNRFTPEATGYPSGVKFIFRGDRYTVIADMASGYLRIYDSAAHSYIDLDGNPSNNQIDTHFKIKRREEL